MPTAAENQNDPPGNADTCSTKDRNSLEFEGRHYSRSDSYKRLSLLARELQQNRDKSLPIDDYQKLRGWIEFKDREKFAGELNRQMKLAIDQHGAQEAQKHLPAAGPGCCLARQ